LGQPERIEHFAALKERPEDRSVEWIYDVCIQLTFASDDQFLLGCIEVSSMGATLDGLSIMGCTENDLKRHFPELQLDDDRGEFGQYFVLRERELSFWLLNGVVDSVTVFPEYNDTDEFPVWPSQ
jgi:hypothetical protein